MTKGTLFDTIHTSVDLNLIQQKVEITPAEPKTNFVDIPGADGSKDLTEALGVGVKYKDREITWTFALYPGQKREPKFSEVANALNGKSFDNIVLDDDCLWYYSGRVTVTDHKSDKLLHQITVKGTVKPYKLKRTVSIIEQEITAAYKRFTLLLGAMPLIPTITVGQNSVIKYGNTEKTVEAGTHLIPEFFLSGKQSFDVKTESGSGIVKFEWREGSQ